jgi:hypothetical protein
MFVREAVKEVLRQCRGHWLLEGTLMQQVNLTLSPAAAPSEITEALAALKSKGKADWRVDDDDHEIKRWQTTEAA